MKSFIRNGRVRGEVGISDASETIAKLWVHNNVNINK